MSTGVLTYSLLVIATRYTLYQRERLQQGMRNCVASIVLYQT